MSVCATAMSSESRAALRETISLRRATGSRRTGRRSLAVRERRARIDAMGQALLRNSQSGGHSPATLARDAKNVTILRGAGHSMTAGTLRASSRDSPRASRLSNARMRLARSATTANRASHSQIAGTRLRADRDALPSAVRSGETPRRRVRSAANAPIGGRSTTRAMLPAVRLVSLTGVRSRTLRDGKADRRTRKLSRARMKRLENPNGRRSTISAAVTKITSEISGLSPGKAAMSMALPHGRSEARPTGTGRSRRLLIAVDGPAAAGKTTVARELAARAGAIFLDTGLLYRAITVLALREGISPSDGAALTDVVQRANLRIRPSSFDDGRPFDLLANGEDLTALLRTPAVDASVSAVAAHPGVRAQLLPVQRSLASQGRIVMVGRDIATVVAPDAELKIYLDASPAERAQRRHAELAAAGSLLTIDDVLADLVRRDDADSSRETAPLAKASDAIVIDSDNRSVAEIVDQIAQLANARYDALARGDESEPR